MAARRLAKCGAEWVAEGVAECGPKDVAEVVAARRLEGCRAEGAEVAERAE